MPESGVMSMGMTIDLQTFTGIAGNLFVLLKMRIK